MIRLRFDFNPSWSDSKKHKERQPEYLADAYYVTENLNLLLLDGALLISCLFLIVLFGVAGVIYSDYSDILAISTSSIHVLSYASKFVMVIVGFRFVMFLLEKYRFWKKWRVLP